MTNPLIEQGELLAYNEIRPEHIKPAIEHWLERARTAVNQVTQANAPATYDSVVTALDDATEPLWRAWSAAGHLNSVVNTPELRDAYNEVLPMVVEFGTWLGLHEGLYAQYRRLHESSEYRHLPAVRQRIIELALRDFRLSGVELQGEARERFAALQERQAALSQKFSENVLDATDAWSLDITDEARLAGLPEDVFTAARAAAEAADVPGWRLTLQAPCYVPVMQYAHDAELRAEMYRAYATRASEMGDPRYDNSELMAELLQLRHEEAQLLGFDTFASRQLQTRMARSASQVLEFLRELARRARPAAEADLEQLKQHARSELGMNELQPWDVAYVSEHLRQHRYHYSEEALRPYFPLPRVLEGWFDTVETLFAVRLQRGKGPVWHPDVMVIDVSNPDGSMVGHLYLDLYARTGKQAGAWVDLDRHRRRKGDHLQTPIVFLTCNFAAPQGDRPSLLTHDDVVTLFHEAGHALHALLSEVDEIGASAFSSVEWDAIELPSQFMENFVWEYDVLQRLSGHVDTGEALPRELYDKLHAARNFLSGMGMLRQVEFSLFDMLLHQRQEPAQAADILATLQAVRNEVAVIQPPEWHRFPHAFGHIFAGGYSAGYYSYKWAEVLSADAYAAFEEAARKGSRLVPELGQKFRREVLAVGGARPAEETFRAFRGREPDIEALLRHSGLTQTETTN